MQSSSMPSWWQGQQDSETIIRSTLTHRVVPQLLHRVLAPYLLSSTIVMKTVEDARRCISTLECPRGIELSDEERDLITVLTNLTSIEASYSARLTPRHFAALPNITRVSIEESGAPFPLSAVLKAMPQLLSLTLKNAKIVVSIKNSAHRRNNNAAEVPTVDADAAAQRGETATSLSPGPREFPQLTELCLRYCRIVSPDPTGLQSIRELVLEGVVSPVLRKLTLEGSAVEPPHLAEFLAPCRASLHQLELTFDNCDDEAAAEIAKCTALKTLSLRYTTIQSKELLRWVSTSPTIRTLDLRNCVHLTDSKISVLASAKALTYLDLCQCKHVTEQGVAILRAQREAAKLRPLNIHCEGVSATALPSSTLQILGAEKALFRALKANSAAGVPHAAVSGAQAQGQGKIGRLLAERRSKTNT